MAGEIDNEIDDGGRRPIRSRELGVMQAIARWLALRGVSPNSVSVSSMVFGLLGAVMMVAGGTVGGWQARLLFVGAAVCIQLRLLANLFDGMVAQESGKASLSGKLLNEWPDRISDVLLLIGFGWLVLDPTSRWLGPTAACLAVMTAYVRELARCVAAPQAFQGPMAKPQRMAVLTLAMVVLAVWPGLLERPLLTEVPGVGFVECVLGLIILGCSVTVLRRLYRIHRHAAGKGSEV